MPSFFHDGINFHYFDNQNNGQPLVCLHGLGGNLQQPKELFQAISGYRIISLDFRGHGQTFCSNEAAQFRMARFAEDVKALLDFLQLDKVVLAGISLGAAVSLAFTLRYPERVEQLILVRPAWLNTPRPAHLRVFEEIQNWIAAVGTTEGFLLWRASESFKHLQARSIGCAESLHGQFTRSQAGETWNLLQALVNDAPFQQAEDLQRLTFPALVIGNAEDPLHPLELAVTLAELLPNATFKKVAPRYVVPEQFQEEAADAVAAFLENTAKADFS